MTRILMLASFGLEIVECGGTLARHIQAGDEVFAAVTLSTPAYRPQITKAAQVLGIAEVDYLDFPTGAWELDLAAKEKIVTLIRRVRPDIVICQDPHHAQHDLDPDRRLLALLHTEALALAGRDYWRKDECGGYAGHLVSAIYYMTPEQPNCVVEISETFALKQRALAELDYQHAFSATTIEGRMPAETLRQVISDYDSLKADKSALGLALQREFDKAHALVHGLAGHAKATLAEAYRREGVFGYYQREMVIRETQPRVVIPMHYHVPGATFKMLPITELTKRFPADAVRWIEGSTVELTRATLPVTQQLIVLQPSTN